MKIITFYFVLFCAFSSLTANGAYFGQFHYQSPYVTGPALFSSNQKIARHNTRPVARPIVRSLPKFDVLYVRGAVNLLIEGGHASNVIRTKGYYPDLSIKLQDNALYIYNPIPVDCKKCLRPVLRLQVNSFRQIIVSGDDSMINVCHLNPYWGMTVCHCGSGCLAFQGPIALNCIRNTCQADIHADDVTSGQIDILCTRNGSIRLSGFACLLKIRAFENAVVDTRCLRSDEALVQSGDASSVLVNTCCRLDAFACDCSNIYNYGNATLSAHQSASGNVLRIGQ